MEAKTKTQICVPVCEATLTAMQQAAVRASEVGDLIELRFDCLTRNELNRATGALDTLLSTMDHPVIITLRPAEQGGGGSFELKYRRDFFDRPFTKDFVDIELDLATMLMAIRNVKVDWKRVICSHHDFQRVPADLTQIYERLAATPARILKIAVQAQDVIDCLPVFKLMERARIEGREIIAIAMGEAGIASRILGPSRGGFLTYGSLGEQTGTAPGQVPAAELRQLYRVDEIDSETGITGLIGCPVSHSISPHIQNAAFAATRVNAVFIPFEVHDLRAFVTRMANPLTRELNWNLRGLSVTAPHKSAVMDLLDSVHEVAREIGAVNTIVIDQDHLLGYNTDAAALIDALKERVGDLKGANCAVVGAGGAARAALWGLRSQGAATTLFARDLKKASLVADRFAAHLKPLRNSSFREFDVVVNATPLGTRGPLAEETPAIAEQLGGARLVYDLVYNPSETRFLREARAAGCETLGGLTMLVNQAVEQFRLWTGIDPSYEVMQHAATRALSNE